MPAAASEQRAALIGEVARRITALGQGRLRVAVDGLTTAGKTSLGHELAAVWLEVDADLALARGIARGAAIEGSLEAAVQLHRDRCQAAELLYISEVGPIAHADVVIDNNDFARPMIVEPGAGHE